MVDESNLTDVGKLAVGEYIVHGQMNYRKQIYFVEDTEYEAYLKQLGLNPEEYLRAENPKLLILNAVKGAADFDDGRRRFYEGSMFQDSSKLTEISIMEQKKIGDASYAYPDPEDPSMMIYLVGDGRTAQSDDDFKKFKVPVEESMEKLSFEIGETVNAEDYPYWAWAGDWGFVLPLSAYNEELFIMPKFDVLFDSDCSYFTGEYCQYNHDGSAASHKGVCDDKSSRLQQVHIFKNDFRGEFKLYTSRICDRRADGSSGKL